MLNPWKKTYTTLDKRLAAKKKGTLLKHNPKLSAQSKPLFCSWALSVQPAKLLKPLNKHSSLKPQPGNSTTSTNKHTISKREEPHPKTGYPLQKPFRSLPKHYNEPFRTP